MNETEVTTIGSECFTDGTVLCYKGENYTRQPRQVTSRAHLTDLEDPETILTDYLGNAYQWGIGLDGSEGWQSTRDPNPITSGHLLRFAPLVVLRVGTAK